MRVAAGLVLVSLGLVLAAAPRVEARCAMVGMTFQRIGTGNVAAGAPSFLLGLGRMPGTRELEPTPAQLSLVASGARLPLTVEAIAPGLLRVRSTAAVSAGTYALEGGATRGQVVVSPTADITPLAAPQVAALTLGSGRSGRGILRADLSAPVPANAVAVIVSSGGVAVAWNRIERGATTDITVAANARCSREPSGWMVPRTGASVTLQFVDASGAVSSPSRAITVP